MRQYKQFAFACLLPLLLFSACRSAKPVEPEWEEPQEYETEWEEPAEAEAERPVWLTSPQTYKGEEDRLFRLLHTRIVVQPNWQQEQLKGAVTLTLEPWFYPQDTLLLDSKGLDIEQVQLVREADSLALNYEQRENKLWVQLPQQLARGQQAQVHVRYTTTPGKRVLHEGEAIAADKGFYFINAQQQQAGVPRQADVPQQLWTQGEPTATSAWVPTLDQPNQKTTQELLVTVDTAFRTLSNGVLVRQEQHANGTRTDYWQLDKPHSVYLTALVVGKFAEVEAAAAPVPVAYYTEPEYAAAAEVVFGETPEMMRFFGELLDYAYPWPNYKQVVVRDFVSGAMENTTISVFYDALLSTEADLLDESHEPIIAHELFHHWFGNLVTAESWSNLPLNESFATYGEYLWLEHRQGKAAAELHRAEDLASYLNEAGAKRVPLFRYGYRNPNDLFDNHSYAKGGLLLHLLRNEIGDACFFRFAAPLPKRTCLPKC